MACDKLYDVVIIDMYVIMGMGPMQTVINWN